MILFGNYILSSSNDVCKSMEINFKTAAVLKAQNMYAMPVKFKGWSFCFPSKWSAQGTFKEINKELIL